MPIFGPGDGVSPGDVTTIIKDDFFDPADFTDGQVPKFEDTEDKFIPSVATDEVDVFSIDKSILLPPGSMQLGGVNVSEAGDHLHTESDITGDNYLLVDRKFDNSGSMNITSEKLNARGIIETIDLTGTPFTVFDGLQGSGASSPGINAYQNETRFFTYEEIVNLTITQRIDSHTGPIVATVPSFSTGPITPEVAITGITQANPVVVTAVGHGRLDGERAGINGVVGMTEINGFAGTVANSTANTFEITEIDSTAFTAYTSGGVVRGQLVEIPFDNMQRINPSTTYFSTFNVDQPFLIDGGGVGIYTEVVGWPIDGTDNVLTSSNTSQSESVSSSGKLINVGFSLRGRWTLDNINNDISSITAYVNKSLPLVAATIDVRVIYGNPFDNSDVNNGDIYYTGTLVESAAGEHAIALTATATPIPALESVYLRIEAKEFGSGQTYYAGTEISYGAKS